MQPTVNLFDVTITLWPIFALSGAFICWLFIYPRSQALGYDWSAILNLLIYSIPAGFVGAFVTNWIVFELLDRTFTLSVSMGTTVTGSIISCFLFGYYYCKHLLKINPLQFLDAIAFSFPLSILVGRIGCLFAGCCYGDTASDDNWLTLLVGDYAVSSPAHQHYLEYGLLQHDLVWNLPAILIINNLATLVICEVIYRNRHRWRLPTGFTVMSTLLVYSLLRLVTEQFRLDTELTWLAINPWQAILLMLLVFSVLSLIAILTKAKTTKIIS
ncbi:MAG: prolipoprotein diacylglyceryl transferase family protein [Kangiellaceae bacterium]|jgi:prolipoprotein diacylglyceryltransferase|nr:prolipoprotein diacylglyceryl transferase family protein [Kangiellaceae bacterium]